MDNKLPLNVLIVSSGSVASLKVPVLINLLNKGDCVVRLIVTDRALHFLEAETPMPKSVEVFSDSNEWSAWQRRGDPVLHIELMRWADVLVLAPISANTLAKVAQGLCDNLATCVARAWPLATKPALFCPAMNTNMWEHPVTVEHVTKLQQWGYQLVPCVEKTLICGDKGLGAMAEVETIVNKILSLR